MVIAVVRWLFYRGFVWNLTRIFLGLNIRRPDWLPQGGPAVIVANHNSHLDTLVLVTLLPARLLPFIQPVAAADYFLRNRLVAWFALEVVGILPIRRGKGSDDPLAGASQALSEGKILIFFPEGSRGEPERLAEFKAGLWHLLKRHPAVPIHPVAMHGLGKSLPKGSLVLVPFFCDVTVGAPLAWQADRGAFMKELRETMDDLGQQIHAPAWE